MWGRAKIGPLIRAEDLTASGATVGIIHDLIEHGVVQPVPALRKRPHARRWTGCAASPSCPETSNPTGRRPRPARCRLREPLPDQGRRALHRQSLHSGLTGVIRSPSGPSESLEPRHIQAAASFLDKLLADMASRSRPSKSRADPSSWPPSNRPAGPRTSASTSCRPDARR